MNSKMKHTENEEAKLFTHGNAHQTNKQDSKSKEINEIEVHEPRFEPMDTYTGDVIKNKEELIEFIDVPGSPFKVIRQEKEYYTIFGQYRLSEAYESKEEAIKDAQREDWMRVMHVMEIIAKFTYEDLKQKENGK